MSIEEVIDRAVQMKSTIEIEYCSRSGRTFTCSICDIQYSQYYGGHYIVAFCNDWGKDMTFKISRIQRVNGHAFTKILWDMTGYDFKNIY